MGALRWVLALVLAAFFVFMGVQKFGGENIVFATIAERSEIPLFEPVVRMITGAAEIFAAILLVIPKMRTNGARIALLILLGAIGFHLSPWLGINVDGMGSSLFVMALGALILTCTVLLLEMLMRQ
ncbi:MAG: DoxX family protein [Robiginitomaculum sp.]|nr:DoxX family protein [Robiginitomaculum sp.]